MFNLSHLIPVCQLGLQIQTLKVLKFCNNLYIQTCSLKTMLLQINLILVRQAPCIIMTSAVLWKMYGFVCACVCSWSELFQYANCYAWMLILTSLVLDFALVKQQLSHLWDLCFLLGHCVMIHTGSYSMYDYVELRQCYGCIQWFHNIWNISCWTLYSLQNLDYMF